MAVRKPLVQNAGNLEELPIGDSVNQPAIACRIYNNANISLTNGAGGLQTLTFNSERDDPLGMHSTSTNTNRITAVVAGWYLALGNLRFAAHAAGYRECFFQKNSTLGLAFGEQIVQPVTVAGVQTCVNFTGWIYLAVNDWVDMVAAQSSGGALNIEYTSGNQISPEFSLIWFGYGL